MWSEHVWWYLWTAVSLRWIRGSVDEFGGKNGVLEKALDGSKERKQDEILNIAGEDCNAGSEKNQKQQKQKVIASE